MIMSRTAPYERLPEIENKTAVKFRKYTHLSTVIPHWHEQLEWIYFLTGPSTYICNGKSYPVQAGDFAIANKAEIHSFSSPQKIKNLTIQLYPDFFYDVKISDALLTNVIHGDEYIQACCMDMYDEYVKDSPDGYMMIKSHAYRLMAYLLRNYRAAEASLQGSGMSNANLLRLTTVLEFISANYGEKITTKQLAQMTYLSESHFCRFFKAAVGKSPTNYINEYRIEKATVLLSNTDESITSIAKNVGFDDINYFSRTFKKIKKVSPSDYKAGL